MKLYRRILGPMASNCYILHDPDCGETLVVDPGYPDPKLAEAVAAAGGNLTKILLTHGHFDHIGGTDMLKKEYPDCKVIINVADADMLTDEKSNLSYYYSGSLTVEPADILVTEGSELYLGSRKIKIYHTPGHSPGSSMYQIEDMLFSGDTLFAGTIGNYDQPGGSWELYKITLQRIRLLDPALKLLPGHGSYSTIENELRTNSFLQE